jgi:hypothetical protein
MPPLLTDSILDLSKRNLVINGLVLTETIGAWQANELLPGTRTSGNSRLALPRGMAPETIATLNFFSQCADLPVIVWLRAKPGASKVRPSIQLPDSLCRTSLDSRNARAFTAGYFRSGPDVTITRNAQFHFPFPSFMAQACIPSFASPSSPLWFLLPQAQLGLPWL